MSHPLTAVLAVSLVIIQDQKVLVLLEQKNDGPRYNVPGGRFEFGEGVLAAAIREAAEETGFSIRLGSLVQIMNRTWEDGHHSVRQTYTAEIIGGELKTEEGSEAFWMTREEVEAIPENQWNFATKQAITLAFEEKQAPEGCVVMRADGALG